MESEPVLMETNYLDVTAAIIWQDEHILISQRKLDDSFGGRWEFPGGKRRSDETLEACLVREIKEELDIQIQVIRPATRIVHPTPDLVLRLHVFHCQFIAGTPKTMDCADWKWVLPVELLNYEFLELDYQVIDLLLQNESSKGN